MSRLEKYLQREWFYVLAALFAFFAVETTINATSLVMEAANENNPTPPWVWFALEYTSGVALVLLFPLVHWFTRRYPVDWINLRKNLLWHIPGSLVFSLLHIQLMLVFRKAVFYLFGQGYSMGDFSWQLLYEYRKDFMTYILFVAGITIYGFIMGRLRGEAQLVQEGENDATDEVPDRLLVKKLGKEFIVRVDDIEWLESSGNYVNLHVGKRIYPLRSTLSSLVGRLEPRGFRRTHRSSAVNLDFVASITPLESGDAEVLLTTGARVALSRRYRDEFRSQLGLD